MDGEEGGVMNRTRSISSVEVYDCFVNYRVWCDRKPAETLYYALKAKGFSLFWDKISLEDGAPWEDGFIKGLQKSRKILLLISEKALEGISDKASTQADNVLKEYELAVDKFEAGDKSLIIPLLLGEYIIAPSSGDYPSSSALKKFQAFTGLPQKPWPECYSTTCKTRTIKQTMETIFSIQGIHIDPDSIPSSVDRICAALGQDEKRKRMVRLSSFGKTIDLGQHMLDKKLKDPKMKLSVEESVQVVSTCLAKGRVTALKIDGEDAIFIIGNTGAGKSTFINYLCRRKMRECKKKDIGLKGTGKVIIVEGNSLARIGHDKNSATFLPDIIIDAEGRVTYCDCPGFKDNRGAEINIANAVNIRTAAKQSRTIRVVVLINYKSIQSDRGQGLKDLLKILQDLFGDEEQLMKHKDSVLLGITQFPRVEEELEDLKDELADESSSAVIKDLAQRAFIYDPLDRPFEDNCGLKREAVLETILAMPPLNGNGNIFRTVLLATDEAKVREITEVMGDSIMIHLKEEQLEEAGKCLANLNSLSAIEHETVLTVLKQAQTRINDYYHAIGVSVDRSCSHDEFEAADAGYEKLLAGKIHFQELPFYSVSIADDDDDVTMTMSLTYDAVQRTYKDAKLQRGRPSLCSNPFPRAYFPVSLHFVTETPPEDPADLEISSVNDTGFHCEWSAPFSYTQIEAYEIHINGETFKTVVANYVTITDLDPGVSYKVQVCAKNFAGLGKCSAPTILQTTGAYIYSTSLAFTIRVLYEQMLH
jgi:guanylate kinase